MRTLWLPRVLAVLAVPLAGSRKKPVGLALAGALAGFAVFGITSRPLPSPFLSFGLVLSLTLLFTVFALDVWPPIAAEAAFCGALVVLPPALFALWVLRDAPLAVALGGFLGVAAALSLFAAEGSRANAEAGWRRGALWTGAVLLPPCVAAGESALLQQFSERYRAWPAVAAGAMLLVAWAPAVFGESRRARLELDEEVRLGLLPAEDAAALRVPWRRRLEKRFGRADERREYVRSALLLAVARRQQRRRTGEAERLRQLEVLTFRTRLRRTLDARAGRYQRGEPEEVPAFDGPDPGEE